MRKRTYDSDPSESGDTLTDGAQVVEQRRRTILLAERLNRLNCLRRRCEQFHHLRLDWSLGS